MIARKAYHGLRLFGNFVWELLLSNLAVLRIVLSPSLPIRPGVLAYSTRLTSPVSVTVLANLITLTPGTLTLDVSDDRKTLFIHTLNVEDPEAVLATIRVAFEQELLELER